MKRKARSLPSGSILRNYSLRIKPLCSKKSTLQPNYEESSHKMYPLLTLVYHGNQPYATITHES